MGQIIHLLIIIGSLAGIAFILYRKIPLLLALSAEGEEGAKQSMAGRVKSAAQQKILDRTMAKARTLASKTEIQTAEWLERLRKKSEQRKEEFSESYWEQLRRPDSEARRESESRPRREVGEPIVASAPEASGLRKKKK